MLLSCPCNSLYVSVWNLSCVFCMTIARSHISACCTGKVRMSVCMQVVSLSHYQDTAAHPQLFFC